MITQTFKCNFSLSCLTRHSSIWKFINDSIHCSIPFQLPKLAKSGIWLYDIVIFNGNVLGHAWHTWCKKGTDGKMTSCTLLMGHMQIFKLIDCKTMGLWIWITFFLIRTVMFDCLLPACWYIIATCMTHDTLDEKWFWGSWGANK